MDILVLDSDREVGKQLQVLLERQGHRVLVSGGAPEALSLLGAQRVDVLVAECRLLAQHGAALFRLLGDLPRPPLIVPTTLQPAPAPGMGALAAELERVQEVMALVQRLLTQPQGETLRVGGLAVDTAGKRVMLHGHPVPLPPIQFRLLAYLMQNAGRVVGARELLKAVWGYEGDETEARELVKVHVRQIRRRLGQAGPGAEYVQSMRGFGYMVAEPVASTS